MLNISHIKIRPIKIFLLWVVGSIFGCYMPGGIFLVEPNKLNYLASDSIAVDLPIEYQVYNYFKVTYVKNKQVYPVSRQNDSTLVFSLNLFYFALGLINLYDFFKELGSSCSVSMCILFVVKKLFTHILLT